MNKPLHPSTNPEILHGEDQSIDSEKHVLERRPLPITPLKSK